MSVPCRPILPVFALLLAVGLAAPRVFAQTGETATVYADYRDRIVQIQVIDRLADTKAGIGSGFVAGRSGWVVTNYHVIADLVNESGKYEARWIADGQEQGVTELLYVDPVHDLALLRAEGLARPPLALGEERPPKGTRLWSMGYPFDIGLTIVEGTFNGTLEKSLYEKLHFTGSINPGMSGGPTLDRRGRVVGVNVSTAGNQVSFLVPVRHVARMLDEAGSSPPADEALHGMAADHLLLNQQRIVDALLAEEPVTTRLDGYRVPGALAPYLNCWGNSEEDEEEDLALTYYRCQTQDDIYLSSSLNTGIISYQHDLVSTRSLGALRFYQQLENRSYYPRLRLDGDRQTVTNYRCQADFVEQDGAAFKTTFCVRRYLKLAGLYDAFLHMTSLTSDHEALQSTLVLAGFSWDNVMRLGDHFMTAFGWRGPAPGAAP